MNFYTSLIHNIFVYNIFNSFINKLLETMLKANKRANFSYAIVLKPIESKSKFRLTAKKKETDI